MGSCMPLSDGAVHLSYVFCIGSGVRQGCALPCFI